MFRALCSSSSKNRASRRRSSDSSSFIKCVHDASASQTILLTIIPSTQTQIHNEPEAKVTRKGFRRFLVDSPLEVSHVQSQHERALLFTELVPSCQTEHIHNSSYNYGSQHGLYYLDGKLIALAVLDVLPGAVSSVYFAWDPAWSALGLGKISALREAAMVREMKQDGVEGMDSYMMGARVRRFSS